MKTTLKITISLCAITAMFIVVTIGHAKFKLIQQSGIRYGYDKKSDEIYSKPNISIWGAGHWYNDISIFIYMSLLGLPELKREDKSEVWILFRAECYDINDFDCAIMQQQISNTNIYYYKGKLEDAYKGHNVILAGVKTLTSYKDPLLNREKSAQQVVAPGPASPAR
jgi:hypothetical protein